jgi:hypothetical protein
LIPVKRKGKKIIIFSLLASGALTIAISSFAAYMYYSGQSDIVGQPLVDSEFPPQSISPIYLKPATWLMISTVISWYCILELVKEKLAPDRKVKNSRVVSALFAIMLVIAVVSFYEVLFNFFLWGSLMAISDTPGSLNPDKLVNPYPPDGYKINLAVATKVGVTIFACSLYGIYVFKGLRDLRSS